MNRNDFFKQIINKCDFENQDITEERLLEDFEDWDSLALITIMSLFKTNFNKVPSVENFQACKTFKDILDLAGEYYEK